VSLDKSRIANNPEFLVSNNWKTANRTGHATISVSGDNAASFGPGMAKLKKPLVIFLKSLENNWLWPKFLVKFSPFSVADFPGLGKAQRGNYQD